VTSKRAQRRTRALERATVATTPAGAPAGALERWRLAEITELGAGLVVARVEGSAADHAAALRRFLDHPSTAGLVGFGRPQHHRARRVQVEEQAASGVTLGDGRPKACFLVAAEYALDHAHIPGLQLVHGLIRENGLAWMHAWCEIGDRALYDPTTSRFFDPASFYKVLEATPGCVYTPSEAAARVLAEQSPGPWEFGTMIAGLVQEWTARLQEQSPGLLEWVARMRATDPAFAASWERTAEANPFGIIRVHVLDHLERHPQWWRNHRPGVPWPHQLHPLGELR